MRHAPAIRYTQQHSVKRLATILSLLVRWAARQALTSLVILGGAVAGWCGRKAAGPVLVSESVQARPAGPSAPTGPRPAPVVAADPVARAWLDEASSLNSPSATLLRLRRQLESGEISDFGRLARAMLTHPLRRFRTEALAALLPAWGEKDPGGALQFLAGYGGELKFSVFGPDEQEKTTAAIARSWVAADPEAALLFLTPTRLAELELREAPVFHWAVRTGDPAERLRLLAAAGGEAEVAGLLRQALQFDAESWATVQRRSSADDWRARAAAATHPELKDLYQSFALDTWLEKNGRSAATAAAASAWLGAALSPVAEASLVSRGPPGSIADFLRSGTAAAVPSETITQLFATLLQNQPEAARELYRDGLAAAWMEPKTIANTLRARGEAELRAWLGVLPEPGQRQELLKNWMLPVLHPRTPEDLAAGVAQALAFGPDGEAVAVAVLERRTGSLAQQVPEVFAALPPDVQARTRLDLVTGLGERAPDVAAELWMDATPEELAQPGVAVVAEELTKHLLRRDAGVASAWIQQLPAGESRDRAVARMIEHIAPQDPASCAEWAATIADPPSLARATAALEKASSTRSSP